MRDYWGVLKTRNCGALTWRQVLTCGRWLAERIPQEYRAGRVIADLGEVWACTVIGLTRMTEGQEGYDAKDEGGLISKRGATYQIKTRSPQKGAHVNEVGTLGGFTSFNFDGAILVLMDNELQVDDIYLVDQKMLQRNLRKGRKDIAVVTFKRIGKKWNGEARSFE